MADEDPEIQPDPVTKAILDEATGAGLDWRGIILVPALAIFSAFVLGGLVIFLAGEGVGTILTAFGALVTGSVGSLGAISETLTFAAPLILAGLAVGIGFRAGLFNIGGEGQILMGGMTALAVGFSFEGLPAVIHLPLALLGGIVGGAIWGGIPGWLRAVTGAHEVITTIMFNFVAANLTVYLLKSALFQEPGRSDPISKPAFESARLPRLLEFLDEGYRVHSGIIVALLAAAFSYWLLFKSTIGFEFRAVGANPSAARYAGMNTSRAYIAVMAVAGAMAGLAGASQILGNTFLKGTPGFSSNIGFDAIAMALLGRSHPVGIVAAGLLFGALRSGGQEMQATANVGIDITTVIQALIIIFIAAPALIRAVYRVKASDNTEQITKGWAT